MPGLGRSDGSDLDPSASGMSSPVSLHELPHKSPPLQQGMSLAASHAQQGHSEEDEEDRLERKKRLRERRLRVVLLALLGGAGALLVTIVVLSTKTTPGVGTSIVGESSQGTHAHTHLGWSSNMEGWSGSEGPATHSQSDRK